MNETIQKILDKRKELFSLHIGIILPKEDPDFLKRKNLRPTQWFSGANSRYKATMKQGVPTLLEISCINDYKPEPINLQFITFEDEDIRKLLTKHNDILSHRLYAWGMISPAERGGVEFGWILIHTPAPIEQNRKLTL